MRKLFTISSIFIVSIIIISLFSFSSYATPSTPKAITIRKRNTPSYSFQKIQGHFIPITSEPFFLLVIGNDYRPGLEGSRADAIHLIGVNPKEKKVTILNFPRDTNVPIPGHSKNKINAANAYGGSALTAKTLEELTGVSISYILETDFAGFTGLINDLGGLEVPVEKPMHDSNSGSNFDPGVHHMDGHQALAFSRDRHTFPTGDLQRTQNQATILISALAQMKKTHTSVTSKFEAIGFMKKHLSTTNLSYKDIYFLMEIANSIPAENINSVLVPWSGSNTLSPRAPELFADFKDNAIIDTFK